MNRKQLSQFLKVFMAVMLISSLLLPSLAFAKESSEKSPAGLAQKLLQEQAAKSLIQEAIADLRNLPYPDPDVLPEYDNRVEHAIIALEKAIDGTFEIGNRITSPVVFEESITAIQKLNFYYSDPKSTKDYKAKIKDIINKIIKANKIITLEALNKLDSDIERYPQKYKSQLKNAFSFYEKGNNFQNENNEKQQVHFYQKAWRTAHSILLEGEAIFDRDGDGVDDYIEKELKLKHNKADSDGDGLLDGYELYVTFTDPLKKDSDGNGIPDGKEDPDNDGLNNLEEQKYGTNPWAADSDYDGLSDAFEVKEFGTNPLLMDTDHDGLDDQTEYELGTDPNNPDTDGDGIKDGLEELTHVVQDPVTNVEVELDGTGNLAKTVDIVDLSDEPMFEEMDSLVSAPVDIEVEGNFSTAKLKIPFDASKIPNGDVENVKMFYFDEKMMTFVPLDNQGVDAENGYVWGDTDHFSTYVLFYIPTWQTKWEAPLNTGDGRDGSGGELKSIDLMFVLDSSGSMSSNDRNGYRKTAAKSFVDALIEGDRAGVVEFASSASLRQALTADFVAVKNSIDRVGAWGGTNIGAGVNLANQQLIKDSSDERIKMQILLTDGVGDYSPSITTTAINNGIIIYTVGLGTSVDEGLLREIAKDTGGQYFPVSSAEELPEVFSRISDNVGESVDTDKDGIPDVVELKGWRDGQGNMYYTLPDNPDTDGDGLLDGEEGGTIRISGVNGDYYQTTSDPTKKDTDGDGLSDLEERELGTSAFLVDTDHDGIIDSEDDDPLHKNSEIDSALDVAKLVGYFAKGLGLGIKDAGLDAWEAITHPVETAEAIYLISEMLAMYIVTGDEEHIQPLIDTFGAQIEAELGKWEDGNAFERAEQIGYNVSAIVLAVIGTKGINAVLKSLKAGKMVPNLPGFADELVAWPKGYDVWSLSSFQRGKEIDEFMGNNLGITFPVVDKLSNRVLTSIKSLDPAASTYTTRPRQIYNRIVEDLNKLNQFTDQTPRNVTLYDGTQTVKAVSQRDYDKKVLEVVLPDRNLSADQIQALNDAKDYASSMTAINKPIELKIIILH
ncbi:VWA domain-containing protein [Bacillus sp. FJAT-27251]|uniref:VWA domain-containing protein n=1 Tax=Bacillus sp. FJAT-27251 TaxID=1684142 RepID=UPI0018D16414|nr:VWA domain-containing protein [Bacillus sp. FJAT-27251]